MQAKNLIQASANVIRITNLSIGDVIKMVDVDYSSPEIYFGVVIDLLNDGNNSFVQIMRYKKSYLAIDCDIKTYEGNKDINIFPTTVEEVKEHLSETIKMFERDVAQKERELNEKKYALQNAKDFVNLEKSKQLLQRNIASGVWRA